MHSVRIGGWSWSQNKPLQHAALLRTSPKTCILWQPMAPPTPPAGWPNDAEWKMWSQLVAQFMPFYSAHSAYFKVLRQKILFFNVLHQKESQREPERVGERRREPERVGESQRDPESEPERARESRSLALSGSPNFLAKSLLGSQGPCSAHRSTVVLHDFLLVWITV